MKDKLIWPDEIMDLEKVKKNDTVYKINWTDWPYSLSKSYQNMADSYFECGKAIFEEIQDDPSNIDKTDNWIWTAIYLARQSLELGLKGMIMEQISFSDPAYRDILIKIFKENNHALTALFDILIYYQSEDSAQISRDKKQWLCKVFISIDRIDEQSDCFRYPFNGKFLEEYHGKFISIDNMVAGFKQAYTIIKEMLDSTDHDNIKDKFDGNLESDLFVPVDSTADMTIAYVHSISQDNNYWIKYRSHKAACTYILRDNIIKLEDKFYPLVYMLRHLTEISIKYFVYNQKGTNLRTHNIKSLWDEVKSILNNLSSSMGRNFIDIDFLKCQELILQMNKLSPNDDEFRYPTNRGLIFYEKLNGKQWFDIENMYQCIMAVVNYLDAVDTCIKDN